MVFIKHSKLWTNNVIYLDLFSATADCNIYVVDFILNTCTALFQVIDANISAIDSHDEM